MALPYIECKFIFHFFTMIHPFHGTVKRISLSRGALIPSLTDKSPLHILKSRPFFMNKAQIVLYVPFDFIIYD